MKGMAVGPLARWLSSVESRAKGLAQERKDLGRVRSKCFLQGEGRENKEKEEEETGYPVLEPEGGGKRPWVL